jgi:ribonuclease HI
MSEGRKLTIYTDGAYATSKDVGGIGIIMLENDKELFQYSNKYEHTSNNQMEIGAVIIALRLIKVPYDSITICTDSQYVIGCATLGWQRKKNKKLWNEFDNQYKRVKDLCSDIKFIHVKGHSGNKYNELVDKLAVNVTQILS